LEADVISLREQVQPLKTAVFSERLAVVDLKEDLQTTSERRNGFEAAANARDQEVWLLQQEVDRLG